MVVAASEFVEGLTVNEAEYRSLLLALDLLQELDKGRLVVCGDSNLAIRQLRGVMDCKAPGLQLLRSQTLDRLKAWPQTELVYVKRGWNGSADLLAGMALQRQSGTRVNTDEEREDLVALNRLDEIVSSKPQKNLPPIAAVTTRSRARTRRTEAIDEAVVQRMRLGRSFMLKTRKPGSPSSNVFCGAI